jgi:hypothetical protein
MHIYKHNFKKNIPLIPISRIETEQKLTNSTVLKKKKRSSYNSDRVGATNGKPDRTPEARLPVSS